MNSDIRHNIIKLVYLNRLLIATVPDDSITNLKFFIYRELNQSERDLPHDRDAESAIEPLQTIMRAGDAADGAGYALCRADLHALFDVFDRHAHQTRHLSVKRYGGTKVKIETN